MKIAFGLGMGLCPLIFLVLGSYLNWTCIGPVYSLCEFICEAPVSLVFSSPPALTTFPLPLPQSSLSPEGRGLIEPSYLGLSVPRSLSLCTLWCCGFLYMFICAVGGSFSDDG